MTVVIDKLPTSSRAKVTQAPAGFNKYHVSILRNVWHLSPAYSSLLNKAQLFLTSVGNFVDSIQQEEYPGTYEDSLMIDGKIYSVSYIFCSGAYLDDLSADSPNHPIAFKLRESKENNFRVCLVKRWDKTWNKDWLIRNGAKEL